MAGHSWARWMVVMVLMILTWDQMFVAEGAQFGVNYGLLGDNLPSPKDIINFIRSKQSIQMVRIYDPNTDVLEALRGSGLSVSIGVSHSDLSAISSSQQAADDWVQKFIIPYSNDVGFSWLSVGNEAIPGPYAQYILPAIKNIQKTIDASGLGDVILVTTTVSMSVLGTSYPPSAGAFSEETVGIMSDIIKFVDSNAAPMMINVYPYFALLSDPEHISLDFALFKSTTPQFMDGDLAYYNLYDAMVDAFVAAMAKVLPGSKEEFDIVIAESGWPSAGGDYATIENAATYNTNFKNHWTQGTPRRPGLRFESFIFALFNENQKPAGTEQNFGNFYPDMRPVYPLW